MSLEGLFTDRKARKFINEAVYNANEILETRVCEKCGREGKHFLSVFDKALCEDCCNKVLENTNNDYDTVYTDISEDYLWESMISEGFIYVDHDRLENDAAAKGMPISKYLKTEYGLTVPGDLGKQFDSKSKVYVHGKNVTDGNTKINRFLDDYNGRFERANTVNDLVPDADGYLAKIKGGASNGVNIPTMPTNQTPVPANVAPQGSTTSTPKAQAAKPAKNVKGNGYTVSGDASKFVITLSSDVNIECTQTSTTTGAVNYEYKVEGSSDSMACTVKDGDVKSMAKEIVDIIKDSPASVFTAFDDDYDSGNGYVVDAYPCYSYVFDDDSFDGKTITVALARNGKVYSQVRIALNKKELLSKAALDGKLYKALKENLAKEYPALINGQMDINTSIGKTVSSFVSVENKKVKIHTEIGNEAFDWETDGSNLKDKEQAINSMFYELYDKHMDKIIPDWSKFRNKSKGAVSSKFTDSFVVSTNGIAAGNRNIDINLNFSLVELYDKHGIIFHVSIIDSQTGQEQPKEYMQIPYTKAGTSIRVFALEAGAKIFKKYFTKSDMEHTLTVSAQEKVKNKSKKVAFLSKVAEILGRRLVEDIGNKKVRDIDIDFEKFDVNSDGKVTDVVIRFSDPFNDVASTSDELNKELLDNVLRGNIFKFVKADDSSSSMKKYGPSVIYKVDDIEEFSKYISLPLLESAMLEALGIQRSGRKVIGVNEAYFIETEDGYELVV